jgi:hypothetical protein
LKQVINSSSTLWSNPNYSWTSCFLCSLPFMFMMNSPVPVMIWCNAILGGIEEILHSCCTYVCCHVSISLPKTMNINFQ